MFFHFWPTSLHKGNKNEPPKLQNLRPIWILLVGISLLRSCSKSSQGLEKGFQKSRKNHKQLRNKQMFCVASFCGTYSNAFGFWCHAEIVHTALHSPKKICKGPMQNNRACPDSSDLQNALNEVLTFWPLTCCPLNFQFKKRSEIRCFCGKQNTLCECGIKLGWLASKRDCKPLLVVQSQ